MSITYKPTMSSETDETSPLVSTSTNDRLASIFLEPSNQHDKKLVNSNLHPPIYTRRWWILFVFCLCASNQAVCCVMWLPLSDALLIAYEWDLADVGLASASTCLTFVVLALPVMHLIETKGIRIGVILANVSLVVASILWNIALFTQNYWLLLMGCIVSGIAPTVTFVLPSLLSVTWFPVSQRNTATSISVLSIYVGMALTFILGPQISGSHVTADDVEERNNLTAEYISDLTQGLEHVGYFTFGLTTVGLILSIAYFPAAPPSPPSVSQTVKREDFLSGLKRLAGNSQYWMLIIAFNVSNSTFLAWLPLISVGFRPLGISELTAAQIGTWATVVNCCFVLLISLLTDRHYFKRKTKLFMKVFAAASAILLVVLASIQMEVIELAEEALVPVLYVLVIAAAVGTQSIFPLYSELACEYAFPVYEGLACTMLMIGNWSITIFFYGLLLVPALSENTEWMTWTCAGGCFISLPLLVSLNDDYRRLDLDEV